MSHLMIITHPSLVAGFHLAGVEAFGVETPERAPGPDQILAVRC